jgi:C-terminal processing protease CtpA/Prc
MRTVTIVGAVLATTAITLTAAAVPQEPKRAPEGDKPRAEQQPRKEERTIRRQLGLFGSREAQIGVSIRDLEADRTATSTGAVVERVAPDSPAERAGMKVGDVITGFDGEKVRSAKQLARLVNETAPGRTVPATVLRDGKAVDLKVTPEAGETARAGDGFVMPPMAEWRTMPELNFDSRMFKFDDPDSAELFEKRLPGGKGHAFEFFANPGGGRLGIGLQDLTPQLAEYFGAKDGALVTTVEDDSPAARAGLKAGDVITAINGNSVESSADVVRAVGDAGENGELAITYLRERKTATATAKIETRKRQEPQRGSERPI